MRFPSDAEIEKLIAAAPPDALNHPFRRRPSPLELRMGVRRAAEWKSRKIAEAISESDESDD